MSESTPDPTTPKPTEPAPQGDPAAAVEDKPLAENGEKALKAERAARVAAEKAATALQKQLDDIAAANLSDLEKAQKAAKDAEEVAARATADALRLRVAAKHGISDEDADLFLTGTDEDTLNRQAERLAARNVEASSPRSPKPDTNQGRSGAGGPKSTADSFAEFFRKNLSER
jgi:hypothetical protein